MTNSPFDGSESPYGPAAGTAAAPTAAPGIAPPPPFVPPAGVGMAAGLPATGYGPPPAYRPYATAPRSAPRLVNPLGGWSLGLGIAAFVFSAGSLATNVLSTILGLTALALGILGLVIARGGFRPRAGVIWGICLAALPVLVAVLRFIGDALSSLR
jgi:hypothetical protein